MDSFSVCGACKTGTLHPLFAVRPKRSSKTTVTATANGRMAATSSRGTFFHIWVTLVFFWYCGVDRIVHAHTRADSPRMVVSIVSTGVRMPGSFGIDDDDEEEAEVDELILGIGKLGVEESRD